jgi:hypothetical protein
LSCAPFSSFFSIRASLLYIEQLNIRVCLQNTVTCPVSFAIQVLLSSLWGVWCPRAKKTTWKRPLLWRSLFTLFFLTECELPLRDISTNLSCSHEISGTSLQWSTWTQFSCSKDHWNCSPKHHGSSGHSSSRIRQSSSTWLWRLVVPYFDASFFSEIHDGRQFLDVSICEYVTRESEEEYSFHFKNVHK